MYTTPRSTKSDGVFLDSLDSRYSERLPDYSDSLSAPCGLGRRKFGTGRRFYGPVPDDDGLVTRMAAEARGNNVPTCLMQRGR